MPVFSATANAMRSQDGMTPRARSGNGSAKGPVPRTAIVRYAEGLIAATSSWPRATANARSGEPVPNDSAGRFTGLPFTVRSLWRFSLPAGRQVLLARIGER